jgi:predicted nucleic acid-binding protein
VLDTNVLLDWLVFGHPCGPAIEARLRAGTARWIASAQLQEELAHVLGRGGFSRWQPDAATIAAAWARHANLLPAPEPPVARHLRCTDADDQKFIDFALAHQATLLSRDRAVLKLARRARLLGFAILSPEQWLDIHGA